jgi:hypothetical protein
MRDLLACFIALVLGLAIMAYGLATLGHLADWQTLATLAGAAGLLFRVGELADSPGLAQ